MGKEELSGLTIDKTSVAAKPGRKRRRTYRILAVLLLIVVGLGLWRLLTPAVEVRVSTVSQMYPSQAFTILNASGYVVAQRKAAVASKATGRLEWLGVEEGSHLKKGQVIARIESSDVLAAREQAAANVEAARSRLKEAAAELSDAALQYERRKELLSEGVIARTEYDAAEARYRKAQAAAAGAESAIVASQAALRATDVAIEYTIIRAPFDGVVLTKNADVGDIVAPLGAAAEARAAVVTIADMSSLQVEADVAESNLRKVHVGQPCEIQLDALPGSRFAGVVHTIMPTADRTKATVMTKIRFLNRDKRILPEMSAMVSFLERAVDRDERKPRTAVEASAVVRRRGRDVVFLVHSEKVVMQEVVLGPKMGDMVEIRRGTKTGDRVVLNPSEKLKDGSRITITEG